MVDKGELSARICDAQSIVEIAGLICDGNCGKEDEDYISKVVVSRIEQIIAGVTTDNGIDLLVDQLFNTTLSITTPTQDIALEKAALIRFIQLANSSRRLEKISDRIDALGIESICIAYQQKQSSFGCS